MQTQLISGAKNNLTSIKAVITVK